MVLLSILYVYYTKQIFIKSISLKNKTFSRLFLCFTFYSPQVILFQVNKIYLFFKMQVKFENKIKIMTLLYQKT